MNARFREALPKARGTFLEQAALKDLVWFRAGGSAELLFRPADEDDLRIFLAQKPRDMPASIIGVGSNLLVRDGGIKGAVIRLPASFGKIEVKGNRVRAGAAALDAAVARAAADAGVGGLEFLRGIPGTIGGALRMNAGCYGREIKDVFVEAVAIDENGTRIVLTRDDISFSYRSSSVSEHLIFTEAVLEGSPDTPEAVRARMETLVAQRESTQPIRAKTGGSTFKNPSGKKAWQLIEEAGCRGLRRGDAQVSQKHCNFLINTGGATGSDLETLGEEVRACVRARSGVVLEWEIKRVGVP